MCGNVCSMSGFLEAVAKVGKFSLRWDDDFFDRCSHRYTVIILVVFVVVSNKLGLVIDSSSCYIIWVVLRVCIKIHIH